MGLGIEIETGISNSALGTYPATLPYISKGGASIWSRHKAPGPVEIRVEKTREFYPITCEFYPVEIREIFTRVNLLASVLR